MKTYTIRDRLSSDLPPLGDPYAMPRYLLQFAISEERTFTFMYDRLMWQRAYILSRMPNFYRTINAGMQFSVTAEKVVTECTLTIKRVK
jgi:hypothetical protein